MIVTTGKVIKIDVLGGLTLERTCESPGIVTVHDDCGGCVMLPANHDDAERFMKAFMVAVNEDIPYRDSEVL